MQDVIQKAGVLIEALPYIKRFYGKTVVIKYGGHAMINPELKKAVVMDVVLMKYVGMHPVLVHGGGPEITALMKKLGKEAQFVDGLRVTDRETVEIVEMVLVGKINKEIVALINQQGGKAVGLSGKDGELIRAKKRFHSRQDRNGQQVLTDLGYVGDVESVNPGIIDTLVRDGYIPVIAPIGIGEQGESYNINADLVAGELAAALGADKLVLLTDVEGIFEDFQDKTTLISSLRADQVRQMVAQGKIEGGMIPKVEACISALEGGVQRTHIIDGRIPHSLLLEIFTDKGVGTMVLR